jgi:predicted transcriptional regulator
VEVSVTDGIVLIHTYFDIEVIKNSIPISNLLAPENNSIVSMLGTELKWSGYDETEDTITYDLYLSTSVSSILMHDKDARILTDTTVNSYLAEGLRIGQTYYWMVIPKDHLRYGVCQEGFYKVIINSPPQLSKYSKQIVVLGEEFKLQVKATDINSDHVRNLQFSFGAAPDGMEIQISTGEISWIPKQEQLGQYSVEVLVSDGIDQSNISFEIEVVENEIETTSNNASFMIITTSIILIIILINITVVSTEVGKYKFLSLFFVPLYNKLNKDKVYDNFTRGQIHGYIRAKPGEHYNALKSALKLKNGTLTHHTKVLEKEGMISIRRDGFFTRFYPIGAPVSEHEMLHLKEVQEELIDIIRHQPGITQHEINNYFKISQPSISYNLTQLTRNNLIRFEQDGREKKYYLIPQSEGYLNHHHNNNNNQPQNQGPDQSESSIYKNNKASSFSNENEIDAKKY